MPKKENRLTNIQFFWLTLLFLLASILNIGMRDMSRDGWLACLVSPIAALPLIFVWQTVAGAGGFCGILGRKAGRIIWIFYFFGSLAVLTFIMSMLTGFAVNTSLEKTPRVTLYIMLTAALMAMTPTGMKGLGRLVNMVLPFNMLLIAAVLIPSVKDSEFGNLLPVLSTGKEIFARDVFNVLSISCASLAMPIALSGTGKKDQSRSVYLGYTAGAAALALILIKNLCILGWPAMSRYYFPSYAATSLIDLGHFFQRLETITSVSYLTCELIKASAALLTAAEAAREISGKPLRYAPLFIAPLSAAASYFSVSSIMELDKFADLYRYSLTLPFILLPLLLFIPALIKKRKLRCP